MFKLSLTKRYIPAILLLVIFIIFSHVLISNVVKSNKELARIINISGKQRMLSQRLIVLGQAYYENYNKIKPFKKTLEEIQSAHKYLISKIITEQLNNIYFKQNLDKNLSKYLKHFQNLLTLHNPLFLKQAREDSLAILIQLDSVVKEYERYSEQKLEIASQYEFYLMVATLLILLLEVIFIFRPAAQQIDKNTKKLIKNKEYEETVIESNNNAIIAIDWTGKITTYNQKAVEIFGWTKEEMIGTRDLLNIIPPKYKKIHTDASDKYLKTGNSCGILGTTRELEGIKKDGTIFPIKISFGSKYKLKNTIVVANILDITKEKKQNDILIQQSKMASIGEMIENISHQWRQPLSVISTSASGLQLEKEYGLLKDEVLDKRLETIVNNTNSLSKTIDDFRNFFQQSENKEKFNFDDILIQVENIATSTFKDNNISLIKNYENNIYCVGFANELLQVIINIFNNAKDILINKKIDKKIIKMVISLENKHIIIKIYDNAGGIADDILPKIFEPYITTKHQSQGTGLGLYMSSEIITNQFHGILQASNQYFSVDNIEYYGACFEIDIPSNI